MPAKESKFELNISETVGVISKKLENKLHFVHIGLLSHFFALKLVKGSS